MGRAWRSAVLLEVEWASPRRAWASASGVSDAFAAGRLADIAKAAVKQALLSESGRSRLVITVRRLHKNRLEARDVAW